MRVRENLITFSPAPSPGRQVYMENLRNILMRLSRFSLVLGIVFLVFLAGCATAPSPLPQSPVDTGDNPPPALSGTEAPVQPGPGPELIFCDSEDTHESEECFEDALLQCAHAVASFWKTSDGEVLNFEVLNLTAEDTCRVRVFVDLNSTSAFAGQSATCVLSREEDVFDAYSITTETCSGSFVESIQKTPVSSPLTQTQPPAPSVQPFSFTVDDDGVQGEQTFTIVKGNTVQFTITVATSNVSFGGATIRGPAGNQNQVSPIFSTGHLAPGQSTTIEFVPSQSFDFAVYWPSSNVQKGAKAHVVVEG